MKKTYFARAFVKVPGQSLISEINKRILLAGVSIGVMGSALAWMFYSLLFGKQGYLPALMIMLVALALIYRYTRQVDFYWQGMTGERYVRDEIEPIIKDGYHILCSFPGEKFDIDCVVVGPGGVYAIEVKNPAKFASDDWVVFEGGLLRLKSKAAHKTITLNGQDPIKQARAHANWLRNYLTEVRGRRFEGVKAVVLFPKFLVEDHVTPDLLVLNPKRFAFDYLPKAPKVLEPGDITMIVAALRARMKTLYDIEMAEAES